VGAGKVVELNGVGALYLTVFVLQATLKGKLTVAEEQVEARGQ
jgi:hypothetical protein